MLGTLERLAKARELRDTVLSQQATPDTGRRVLLRRKADGLRDLLLGRRSGGLDDLDLFNPRESVAALRAEFDALTAAVRDGADGAHEAREDALPYLEPVAAYLANVAERAGDGAEVSGAARRLQADASVMSASRAPAFRARHFATFKEAGSVLSANLVAAAETHLADLAAIQEMDVDKRLEMDRRCAELRPKLRPYRDALSKAIEDESLGLITTEQCKAVQQAYYDADDKLMQELAAWETEQIDTIRAKRDEAQQRVRDSVAEVARGILEASPVTREDAEAWAAQQTITPAAVARFRKMGYDPKAVRADMAEFYRLTGGRLARVTIRSKGGKRASAEGIHGHASSIINLGSSFDKRVLWHEMAHHLEADPLVVAAAQGFLEARRMNDRVVKLRDLTGNSAYRSDEVAYQDHWFNEYVGKVYGGYDVTEVFSMGMESFSDPFMLADRARRDPEMFALMVGFLKRPPHRLFGVVKAVKAQTAAAEAEAAEEAEAERDDALERLAAGVVLSRDDPPTGPREFYYLATAKSTYLGSYGGLDLYACKALRDSRTKRKKAGHCIVQAELRDPGEPSRGYGFSYTRVFGGEVEAKASMFVWSKSGQVPYLSTPDAAKKAAEAYAP